MKAVDALRDVNREKEAEQKHIKRKCWKANSCECRGLLQNVWERSKEDEGSLPRC